MSSSVMSAGGNPPTDFKNKVPVSPAQRVHSKAPTNLTFPMCFGGKQWRLGIFILIWLVFPRSTWAGQLSVDEILRKVSETYQNLQSYSFVVDQKTELTAAGTAHGAGRTTASNFRKVSNSRVELAETKPDKVRLSVKDEFRELVLISDGTKTWTYLPKKKKYTEDQGPPISDAERSESDGISATRALDEYRRVLVNRFRNISRLSTIAKLKKEEQIKAGKEKVDCYVIEFRTPEVTHTLWVDKGQFIVLRSKEVPVRPIEGIEFQTAVSVQVQEASINTELGETLFQFTRSDKATRVESLEDVR